MAKTPKQSALEQPVSDDELEHAVREALASKGALKPSALKKALPTSYQRLHERALSTLRGLVNRGEIYRWSKGSTVVFYPRDPVATLDRVVPIQLSNGALDAQALKSAVEKNATGHSQLLPEWLKNALGRGYVFEHAPAPGSKKKRYGRAPDVSFMLKKEIAALRKALPRLEARGVARSLIAETLLAEVGVSVAVERSSNGAVRAPRDELLRALDELSAASPPGALLLVRELRARTRMSKEDFDATALALAKEGTLTLHHHDHASSLPPGMQSELVQDGNGTHYSGVARRRR